MAYEGIERSWIRRLAGRDGAAKRFGNGDVTAGVGDDFAEEAEDTVIGADRTVFPPEEPAEGDCVDPSEWSPQ